MENITTMTDTMKKMDIGQSCCVSMLDKRLFMVVRLKDALEVVNE